MRPKPRIVLAENDPDWREMAEKAFISAGYVVDTAESVDGAQALLDNRANPVDVAVFDLHLDHEGERSDHTGLDLARHYPSLRRIIWTAEDQDSHMVVEAHRQQIAVSLKRPNAISELVKTVRDLLARRVFLVHGHDQLKETVRWFLLSMGLEVIVLADEPGGSRTIIELLEHSTVEHAVVLLTPDDEGRRRALAGEHDEPLRSRARQNAIFELGFFAATLGREKVFALTAADVELPSDWSGVRLIPYSTPQEWQQRLRDEFRAAGVPLR
jgi:predicted nucleotide-binding protein